MINPELRRSVEALAVAEYTIQKAMDDIDKMLQKVDSTSDAAIDLHNVRRSLLGSLGYIHDRW